MKNLLKITFTASVFLAVSSTSLAAVNPGPVLLAQAAPASAQSAAQAPQLASSDQFIRSAVGVAQSLDAGGAAQVYDTASAAMKRATARQAFVDAIAATNARTGRVVARDWGRVERLQVAAPAAGATASAVPAGSYVTVFLVARNAQGVSHLEQVSFRLDEDNQWRLSGITAHFPAQTEQKRP